VETTVHTLDFEHTWIICKRNEQATGVSSDEFYQDYYAGKYVVTPEAQRWATCYELMMDRLPKHSTEGASADLLIPN
jgi:hypothetical protein